MLNNSDKQDLFKKSMEPVFEGSFYNRLQVPIVLLNMGNIFNIPHTYINKLLTYMSTNLLQQAICMPWSTNEWKMMVMKMGL